MDNPAPDLSLVRQQSQRFLPNNATVSKRKLNHRYTTLRKLPRGSDGKPNGSHRDSRVAEISADILASGFFAFRAGKNPANAFGKEIHAASSTAPATGTIAFAANSGGSSFTDSTGVAYKADANFTGSVGTTKAAISGTSDDTLYQTERYGNFSYSIPVANGNDNVTLKFAESYFTASGKRVFNVAIGGSTVISNLGIYVKAGQNAAYDVVVPVSVTKRHP